MARVVLTTLLVALVALASGCGDDSEEPTGSTSTATTTSTSTGAAGASTELSAADRSAIERTIKTWLLQGECDLMTDTFLEDQTFIGRREEACKTFETIFTKPSYGSSDIAITEIEAAGGEATALVGDDSSEITSEYELVQENGTWLIDSAGA